MNEIKIKSYLAVSKTQLLLWRFVGGKSRVDFRSVPVQPLPPGMHSAHFEKKAVTSFPNLHEMARREGSRARVEETANFCGLLSAFLVLFAFQNIDNIEIWHKNTHGVFHCGLIGGPFRAKQGQSKHFEKYSQMVISLYKNPHMVKFDHLVASSNEDLLQF